MIRFFDIIFSFFGLILLSPVFIIVAILIGFGGGNVFYRQTRIGLNEKPFRILKFRTMKPGSDKKGLLTVGGKDSRITNIGVVLRKYKLDELPQLINVLLGQMSLVGPRPEVSKYVDLYTEDQKKVLKVRPGITDLASIKYFNENDILKQQSDPEKYYIETIMPHKIVLNMDYAENPTVKKYFDIVFKTVFKSMLGK
jgi:lipopolysaccharide/colanic/teichoic acid biosynthesis glycosyltransferase